MPSRPFPFKIMFGREIVKTMPPVADGKIPAVIAPNARQTQIPVAYAGAGQAAAMPANVPAVRAPNTRRGQ